MRRILRKIATGDAENLGDISTLLNPEVVAEIIENVVWFILISPLRGRFHSLNTGVAYSFLINKFNLFLGIGIDIPMSNVADDSIFKGEPWLGIGLGYSVFKQ